MPQSNVFIDSLLCEGVFDQGILKAVFMAGGAGSGKTMVAADLFDIPDSNDMRYASFSSYGLKLVNPDRAFVLGLVKAGYDPKHLAALSDEEIERVIGGDKPAPGTIRYKAKALVKLTYELNKDGRLGMLIDGTAGNYSKISSQKDELYGIGYDTYMVFVNTSLEVAHARNKQRSREVRPEVVTATWHEVQENMNAYRGLFGSNFSMVENSAPGKNISAEVNSAVRAFVNRPVQNPIGVAWIEAMKKLRSRV